MTDRLRWQTLFPLLLSELYLCFQWIFSFAESHCCLQCRGNLLRKLCYRGQGTVLKPVRREENREEYLELKDSRVLTHMNLKESWRESLDCLRVVCHAGDGDCFHF